MVDGTVVSDPFSLQRFVDAQAPMFDQVLSELRQGQKQSHWMWFIFPQIKGFGNSSMASKFAVSSLTEAKAYLDHQLLGARLQQCTQLVNEIDGRSVDEIFGYPDNLKFHSSMTLFARVAPEKSNFQAAIGKYFDGNLDSATVTRL